MATDFKSIGTGTAVVDARTCLMWRRDLESGSFTWADAKDRSKVCGDTVDGYGNWRLPTLIELRSLVDFMTTSGATTNTSAFPNVPADYFWTATGYAHNSVYAWIVDFSHGISGSLGVSITCKVRCVR